MITYALQVSWYDMSTKDDEALNDHRADCVDWVDILKASSKIE